MQNRPLILVVDDDRNEQEIYGRILWYNGFDVVLADDGLEGLEVARRSRPDLALVDLMLPRLDGMTLCARLRSQPATASMPILVLSALPAKQMAAPAGKLGCKGYLEKPTSPLDVLHAVEAEVGRAPSPDPQPGEGPGPQTWDPPRPA